MTRKLLHLLLACRPAVDGEAAFVTFSPDFTLYDRILSEFVISSELDLDQRILATMFNVFRDVLCATKML